ncbi:ECF-type sigma factor [Gemmatimonas aurantiaca]|uniref:ECF-type sigma factor n=1 Tax=Gemmatimonas aurantiaca TaxID=173480 RepID=UPI000310642E|nr:ECF-type sigma factor [Gemmatimonas aurantiaca]
MTELLRAAQAGDTGARDRAGTVVYEELYSLARAYLSRERGDHTLQPTALVHEAYLRLVGQMAPWKNRGHFFGIAAQMMRRVLVDHARRATADRRDRQRSVPLEAAETVSLDDLATGGAEDVLAVHDALEQLERLDPRQARIVELRFFVGLSLEEIAELLDISPATVSRDWAMARAWLRVQLRDS